MRRFLFIFLVGLVAACDGDGGNGPTVIPAPEPEPTQAATFTVTTTNLTVAQPLSPLAAIIHDSSVRAFSIGEAASDALEVLAEAGDNSGLLEAIEGLSEASGDAPLGPGASETLTLALPDDNTSGALLTLVTMLVNTNDAITGINSLDVSALAVGDSMTLSTNAYDTGTEANTEATGTIPGPADGGEGFNPARDDVADQVTLHPGVVTADDGLTGSALNQSHRWDNPVARITVTRTQ